MQRETQNDKLTSGEFIAVHSDKFVERPLIGRTTKVTTYKVEFEWMIGTYSGQWKEWRGRQDGIPVIFTDSVPLTDVLYHPIEFTKNKKLGPQTVAKLKEAYRSYRP